MNKFLWIGFAFVLFIGHTGCKKKEAASKPVVARPKVKLDPYVHQIDYTYFNYRSKVEFTDENGALQFSLNTRCRKDSVMWASVNKAGVEGVRALIRPDSVFVIDKLKGQLSIYGVSHLQSVAGTPMGYEQLQRLWIGNLLYTKDSLDEWTIDSDSSHFVLFQKRDQMHVTSYVRMDNMKIDRVVMNDTLTSSRLTALYRNFQLSDSLFVPQEMSIEIIQNDKESNKKTIVLQHQKIEFPKKDLNFPFNVPKKYEEK